MPKKKKEIDPALIFAGALVFNGLMRSKAFRKEFDALWNSLKEPKK